MGPPVASQVRHGVGALAVVHLPGDAETVEGGPVLHRFLGAARAEAQEDHVGEPRVRGPKRDADEVRRIAGRDVELQGTVLHRRPAGQCHAAVYINGRAALIGEEPDAVGGDPGCRSQGNGADLGGRRGGEPRRHGHGGELRTEPSDVGDHAPPDEAAAGKVSVSRPTDVLLAWSGGKDSALALAALRADPAWQVVGLLTTITRDYDRISMHGVRRAVLEAQV